MTASAGRSTSPIPRPPVARVLQRFDVELEAVTPLHVGTGDVLTRNLDFVMPGGELIVLDAEAILASLPEPRLRSLTGAQLPRLIASANPDEYARYRVPLAPGTSTKGYNEVRPAIKDAFGQPYLPGSTLKGALRTALAVQQAGERGQKWVDRHLARMVQERPPRREFADDAMERELFGADPKSDLLRALRPGDLRPVESDAGRGHLCLVETRVVKRNGELTTPIVLEALRPRTRLAGTLTVDTGLLGQLEMAQQPAWRAAAGRPALGVIEPLQRLSAALIEREGRRHGRTAVGALYDGLKRRLASLDERSSLVWLGWGTGWTAKTLGESLTASPYFEAVAERLRLGRGLVDAATFPTTRRLVVANGQAAQPMGWARLTLTPAAGGR